MSICPNCYKPSPDTANFCKYCGTPLPKAAPVQEPKIVVEEPVFTPTVEKTVFVRVDEPVFEEKKQEVPVFEEEKPAAPVFEEEKPAAPVFEEEKSAASVFVAETPDTQQAKKVFVPAPVIKDEAEEPSVFALGLPEWSIEPPEIMVRRKR